MTLYAFAILLAGCAEAAWGQQTILTVSGPPAPFTISTSVAGSSPTAITNTQTTYYIRARHPAGAQRVTAQLNAPMPVGTTLTLTMAPSVAATSLGPVALDMIARDIVVNIDKEGGTTLGITYVFTATVAAGVIPSQSRTVTFTESMYP